jgi:hypothetical protein
VGLIDMQEYLSDSAIENSTMNAPLLTGGDIASQIPRVVGALRKRYPDAEGAELANSLITVCCPTVAKASNLSEREKTAKVTAFAGQVLQVLY